MSDRSYCIYVVVFINGIRDSKRSIFYSDITSGKLAGIIGAVYKEIELDTGCCLYFNHVFLGS